MPIGENGERTMSVDLIRQRYKLLDPQDVYEVGDYYPGYPKSWGIYYRQVYANIWQQRGGYGLTVWISKKTDYDTGITSADKYVLDLNGVLNVLDRYLPVKEEEQMSLF